MQNDRTNKQVSTELSMSMFNFCKLFSLSSVFDVLKGLCHQNFVLNLFRVCVCVFHMHVPVTDPEGHVCMSQPTPPKNQLFLRYRGLVNFQIQPLKCI